MPKQDRQFMEIAIEEARKCQPEDSGPRPRVGAVAVKNGHELAKAYRGEIEPGDHAEFTLLEKKLADISIAGATIYTTLEPCTSRKHPKIPCAEWLIERKIKRVVIGQLDPNPAIRGKGQLALRKANIDIGVFEPDLTAQIEELNRDFMRAYSMSAVHDTTTKGIYGAYSTLGQEDDLLAWVSTWPAFPDSQNEKILENCPARRMVVVGPVDQTIQLPGVFWRCEIRERRLTRSGLSPLFLYAKPVPLLKIIIAGQRAFLASEPEGRTSMYYDLGRSSDRLKALFLTDLEGARTIEEQVYLFLLRRLQEGRIEALDLSILLQIFEEERTRKNAPHDSRSYDLSWVESLFLKWIPWCVKHVSQNRGWTGLEVKQSQGGDFKVFLKRGGRWLVYTHDAYLHPPKQSVLVLPSREHHQLPKLRIVVTNRCDLGCSYCPPENEDYAGGGAGHTLKSTELSLVIHAALKCGFRKISITGGEPLAPGIAGEVVVKTLCEVVPEVLSDGVRFVIQTNGRHLGQYLERLRSIRAGLALKVSVDAISGVKRVAKSDGANKVLAAIRDARSMEFETGVNFVLTKDTVAQLAQIADWCQKEGVYLKILDLNWYSDIGQRTEGSGALHGILSADLYWEEQYLSPLEFYEKNLRAKYGDLRVSRVCYGVPMFETDRDSSGFFIRIKDSAVGSHYSYECRVCPYFIDKRRCQEGVYEPWITPGLCLKLCRHRRDLHEDLADAVRDGRVEQAATMMQQMLQKFYYSSNFVPLRRVD